MAAKFKKVSISLPGDMVDDLDIISQSFRVTRSALVTQLLIEATAGLKRICEQHILPIDDSASDTVETQRAITATLDRLAGEIETARKSNAKLRKH